MATLEIVKFKQFSSPLEEANISNIVGVGGGAKNDKQDVMLIQALFKLVGYSEYHAKKSFGLGIADLPEPTGAFDQKTIKAIWGFQCRMKHRLLNVDGKIHPGNYKNREIKDITGRLMAITLLNSLAVDGALMDYSTDVIPALKQIAPHLMLIRVAP
jgi:hypothetical protein